MQCRLWQGSGWGRPHPRLRLKPSCPDCRGTGIAHGPHGEIDHPEAIANRITCRFIDFAILIIALYSGHFLGLW
jgi:hypothetical protein